MGKKETELPFKKPVNSRQRAANAHYRIMCAVELFKQGKKLDYSDSNQEKYWAWFYWQNKADKKPAGFAFSRTYTNYVGSTTFVGPRLSSAERQAAEYIANKLCAMDFKIYFT